MAFDKGVVPLTTWHGMGGRRKKVLARTSEARVQELKLLLFQFEQHHELSLKTYKTHTPH